MSHARYRPPDPSKGDATLEVGGKASPLGDNDPFIKSTAKYDLRMTPDADGQDLPPGVRYRP